MPGRIRSGVVITLLAATLSTLGVTGSVPSVTAAPRCSTGSLTPVEPGAAAPWPQQRYAPERLARLATGAGVTVAVIDSGVDTRHRQLVKQVVPGRDMLDGGGDGTTDCVGHGTGVASIIAARPTRGVGFAGLAPGAKILPVRVSEQAVVEGRESGRTVSPTVFAEAIRWAVDKGRADVINLSLVLYDDVPAVRDAVAYAVAKDVVVVAAVGNLHDNGDPRPYPASYEGVIGVGAIGQDGARGPFSQVGPYVDIVAPGAGVVAAIPGRGYQVVDGTSYAAPFVTATAALIRQYQPRLTAAQVAERIIATADPARGGPKDPQYGAGVLNSYRAVTETVGLPVGPVQLTPVTEAPDPGAAARAARRTVARDRALVVAAVAGGVTLVALLVAVVVPRAGRRRWQPADQV